jgi:hypothetical protein
MPGNLLVVQKDAIRTSTPCEYGFIPSCGLDMTPFWILRYKPVQQMVDLYLDRCPVSSIFIVKNTECFVVYSNRCIIIEKLIFYEDVFMNVIDTQ